MNRKILLQYLKEYEAVLVNSIKQSEGELASVPQGSLCIRFRNGKPIYYCRNSSNEKTGRYLGNKVSLEVLQLALKRELITNLSDNQESLSIVRKAIKGLEQNDSIKNISDNLIQITSPYHEEQSRINNEEFVQKWLNVIYEKKDEEECYQFITSSGVRVRAKSEAMIANKLTLEEVPFRYEYPIKIGKGLIVYPDFVVLNKRNHKTYIWEHNGAIDKEDYCKAFIRKVETYSLNGYLPGEKMIYTYESSKCPINMEIVDMYIKKYLL